MHFANYYNCDYSLDENLYSPTQLDCDLMTGFDPYPTDFTDMNQLKQYKNINPENWTPFNVFDWLGETATDNGISYNSFNAKFYNHIDGRDLKKMTEENFIDLARSREAGLKLYQTKQSLFDEILSLEKMLNYDNPHESGLKNFKVEEHQPAVFPKFSLNSNQLPTVVSNPGNVFKTKNGPGRPRKELKDAHKTKHKPYGKIWQFIDTLLSNTDTCPSLIKWDDYNTGTFKFVQPKKVAELWGLRKNNLKMDYNKFTRALRYHYKKGYLNSVEEKRLVYKFGPKAIELRNKSQNIS